MVSKSNDLSFLCSERPSRYESRESVTDNVGTAAVARKVLERVGIVPTADQAKRTYWQLGENWWRQILDGKDHEHGKWVFDLGLHRGHKEHGFLKSLLKACTWATDHLDEVLTFEGYDELHAQACSHFRGRENDTQCLASEVRVLRYKEEKTTSPLADQSQAEAKLERLVGLRMQLNWIVESQQNSQRVAKLRQEIEEDLRGIEFNYAKIQEIMSQLDPKKEVTLDDVIKQGSELIWDIRPHGRLWGEVYNRIDQIQFTHRRVTCFQENLAREEDLENIERRRRENQELFEKIKVELSGDFGISCEGMSPEDVKDRVNNDHRKLMMQIDTAQRERCESLNRIFKEFAQKHGLENPVTEASVQSDRIKIDYYVCPNMRGVVNAMLSGARQDLEDAQRLAATEVLAIPEGIPEDQKAAKIEEIKSDYQEKGLHLAATLYAELEWLHPWIDGQGRADLILLSTLLTREGLHPVILNEPYFSTTNTVESWLDYLKEGLKVYDQSCRRFGIKTEGEIPTL